MKKSSINLGIAKLTTGILYWKRMQNLNNEFENIHRKYEKENNKYHNAVVKSVKRIELSWKIGKFAYIISVTILFTITFVYVIVTSKRVLIMQFLIPGVSLESNIGYAMTLSLHILFVSFGANGNLAGDMYAIIFITQSILMADIFKIKLSEMDDILLKDRNNYQDAKRCVINVIEWHQKYTKILGDVQYVFFWIIFTQVTTSVISILFSLFIILVGGWPGAYIYSVLAFFILQIYCALGTIVEITNDSITNAIYESLWYILRPSEQKMIQILLCNSQHPTCLTVGGFAELTVNTGLSMTRAIYSYMMMLVNFIET